MKALYLIPIWFATEISILGIKIRKSMQYWNYPLIGAYKAIEYSLNQGY